MFYVFSRYLQNACETTMSCEASHSAGPAILAKMKLWDAVVAVVAVALPLTSPDSDDLSDDVSEISIPGTCNGIPRI